MTEIIPAILPKNYEDLKNKVALVRGFTPIVQVDICDGFFVPNLTWPFFARATKGADLLESGLDDHFLRILNEQEGMPFWEDVDFELDLMVVDAIENFDIYTKLGAKRIVFHLEAVGDLKEFKNFLEGIDMYVREAIEIGLSIDIKTSLDKIFPLVENVDFIQCMGIDRDGFQGEEFDEKVLDNIKILREKFPNLVISIDGGVNFETASMLIDAGVSRLIIGSAIFNTEDIIETIKEFKSLG